MKLPFFKNRHLHKSDRTSWQAFSYSASTSTDVGAVREVNEDRVFFFKPKERETLLSKGVIAILADGMGGHSDGALAAQMTIDLVSQHYYESVQDSEAAIVEAVEKTNDKIFRKGLTNKNQKPMGTTCTAVVIMGSDVLLAHVGDTRAYHINKKEVKKLSTDHTYTQFLLDHEIINESQVRNHPERNVITKSLGTDEKVEAEVSHFKQLISQGDYILLCSDGLYEYISDTEMQDHLIQYSTHDASRKLVALAKQRGGHDNISIIIVSRIEASVEGKEIPGWTLQDQKQ